MAGLQTVVYETGVSAIGAGGPTGGWVSGDVASLAASATVICLFDLGPEWRKYDRLTVTVLPVAPSSGFSNVDTCFSDTTTRNSARRPPSIGISAATYSTNFTSSLTTAVGTVGNVLPIMGRYVHVQLTNADGVNALGATAKVIVAAS